VQEVLYGKENMRNGETGLRMSGRFEDVLAKKYALKQ
jgi:hypothetical protein